MSLLSFAAQKEQAMMRAMMGGQGVQLGAMPSQPAQLSKTPSEEIYAKAAAIQKAVQARESARERGGAG